MTPVRALARRPRLAAPALIAALAVGVAAGCSSGGAEPSWTPVALPVAPGAKVVTLTPSAGGLLVGTYDATAAVRPALTLLPADGAARSVPLTPVSGYAREARWASVSVDGDAVVAIGGAPGGAHSNTRWTVWRGTTAAVPEHPQTFETFGGWGAGGLVGAATLHGEPVLVGAWQSDAAALDIATWLAQGPRWVRQRSTGTVLANTPTRLRQAEAVAATSTLVVAVGSVTALDGGIFVTAAAWTAGSARGPWTAVGLPQAEGARAERVGCDAAACLVLGRSGTAVRAWWLDASGSRTVDLAGRTVGDGDHLLAPVVCGARAWLVLPTPGGADVVELDHDAATVSPGPQGGAPTALGVIQDRMYVATGSGGLWRTTLAHGCGTDPAH